MFSFSTIDLGIGSLKGLEFARKLEAGGYPFRQLWDADDRINTSKEQAYDLLATIDKGIQVKSPLIFSFGSDGRGASLRYAGNFTIGVSNNGPLIAAGYLSAEEGMHGMEHREFEARVSCSPRTTNIQQFWRDCVTNYETALFCDGVEIMTSEAYVDAQNRKAQISMCVVHPLGNVRLDVQPLTQHIVVTGNKIALNNICRTIKYDPANIVDVVRSPKAGYDNSLESQLDKKEISVNVRWPVNVAVTIALLKAVVSMTYKPDFKTEAMREYFLELCKTNHMDAEPQEVITWDEGDWWEIHPTSAIATGYEEPVKCIGTIMTNKDVVIVKSHNSRLISLIEEFTVSTCNEKLHNEKIYSIPRNLLLSVMGIFTTLGEPAQTDGMSRSEIAKSVLAKQDVVLNARLLWGNLRAVPDWDTGKVTISCSNNISRLIEVFLDTLAQAGRSNAAEMPSFVDHTVHFGGN